jgi:hypothetical protein
MFTNEVGEQDAIEQRLPRWSGNESRLCTLEPAVEGLPWLFGARLCASLQNLKSLIMTQKADPRTAQFWKVILVNGLLLVLNTIALLCGWNSVDRPTGGFPLLTYCTLPAMSIAVALTMKVTGRWHWGQVIFSAIFALALSILTLIAVGMLVVAGASPA